MLRLLNFCSFTALLALLLAGTSVSAATECAVFTDAPQSRPAGAARHLHLAEGSSRSCMDGCIAQCRAAQQGCSGADCRAQFQICARRCVVSCGSR